MKTSTVMTALGTPSEFRRISQEETEAFVLQYTRLKQQNAVFDFVKTLYGPFTYRIVFLFGQEKRHRPRDANEKITGLLVYDSLMNLLTYDFGQDYWQRMREGYTTHASYFDRILGETENAFGCNSIEELRIEDAWRQYRAMAEVAETILYEEDTLNLYLGVYRNKTEYVSDEDRPLTYLNELYIRESR